MRMEQHNRMHWSTRPYVPFRLLSVHECALMFQWLWQYTAAAAAMQDHEIISVTWQREGDPVEPSHDDSGPIIDVAQWKLSSGEPVSPLVWSAGLTSPLGENLARSNLRCAHCCSSGVRSADV